VNILAPEFHFNPARDQLEHFRQVTPALAWQRFVIR
jgi:hypothetical protein